MSYRIKCPYCFAECMDDEVLFRSNVGYTGDELEQMETSGRDELGRKVSAEDLQRRRLFRRFDSLNSFAKDKQLDEPLIRYWSDRGGSAGYEVTDPHWDMPHIDPKSPNFRQMIRTTGTPKNLVGEDGFVRDVDGFITRVLGYYDSMDDCTRRLCPHCHNPFPLPDYGKFPVVFISVVGITGSGKTVYLNQLLMNLASSMAGTGYLFSINNLEELGEHVQRGYPLPSSTDPGIMRRPLAVDMTLESKPNRGMTVVFYDIAGENCVHNKDENGHIKDITPLGNFIAYCDGLLFLIDPEQVPLFAEDEGPVKGDILDVMNVVMKLRAKNEGHPNWNDIPVATVLTKSDLLRGKMEPDSLIFRNVGTKRADDSPIRGFNRDEFLQIDQALRTRFISYASRINDVLKSFELHAFFGVSAITCGVQSKFEKHGNTYTLDPENEQRFHVTKQWITEWNMRTPEQREYFVGCPCNDKKGQPIFIEWDQSVTETLARSIETEITAVAILFSQILEINLTLWDVMTIDPIGYPMGDPNPRRVDEPLKWILWQQRKLQPYYRPTPQPTKPFWMSNRKYKEDLAKWEADNKNGELAWYQRGSDYEG